MKDSGISNAPESRSVELLFGGNSICIELELRPRPQTGRISKL